MCIVLAALLRLDPILQRGPCVETKAPSAHCLFSGRGALPARAIVLPTCSYQAEGRL